MFIDEKIREYIEQEKNGWREVKEIWKKIRALEKQQKELENYLSTYSNDVLHQSMKNSFDIVLDNVENLANTLNFKTGIELTMLSGLLIHAGYLSVTDGYFYDEDIVDIIKFLDDKTLYIALKVFSGFCNCRHVAAFTKKVLDRFNIKNSIALVDSGIEDFDICEMRLFLHNFHKKYTGNNHVINYISENDYNYFLDITSSQPKVFGAYNQFACSIDVFDLAYPLYSYSYSLFNDEFIDYRKVSPITKEKADYLIKTANVTMRKCKENKDLFEKFYLQNIDNYRIINENYNKVYEKEKKLELI